MSHRLAIVPFLFAAVAQGAEPPIMFAPAVATSVPRVLSISHLKPAPLVDGLCLYHYQTSTTSPECQKYVDQAFGYYYSYVWMEAARSFETALTHDPKCALAWLGLSRSLEKWGRGDHTAALKKAHALIATCNQREKHLIQSRLQEKGIWPDTPPDERKKKAAQTLDDLLTLYDDDQEAWFARAQIADGNASVPYFKALLGINPLHPGANHELVHHYENIRRPLLGWPNAEGYMRSSPKIPHAFHMQAHLATRLGKWDGTSDNSVKAVRLEQEYHRTHAVEPKDDHQYSHHVEVCCLSLVHEGRYAEAKALRDEALKAKIDLPSVWFRILRGQNAAAGIEELAKKTRTRDKYQAAYMLATLALDRDDPAAARPHIDTLKAQRSSGRGKSSKDRQGNYGEVEGRWLCRTGSAEAGLKLLKRSVDQSKDNFAHHAWGNGAADMEVWGLEALRAGDAAQAEEALLEAIAHDSGSVRGLLGMASLCRVQGRTRAADRFMAQARETWSRANPADFEALAAAIDAAAKAVRSTTATR